MKKLLKWWAIAHVIMALAPLQEAVAVGSYTVGSWYDIDSDGNVEFINGNGVYRLDADNNPQKLSSLNFNGTGSKIYRLSAESPLVVIGEDWKVYSIEDDNTLASINLPYYRRQYYPADFRGDGSKGLIARGNDVKDEFDEAYILLDVNGEYIYNTDKLSIMTWNEYHGLRSDLVLSNGSGIPSLADGMFVGSGSGSGTSYGDFRMIDLNGDGLSDMFDASGGRYYLNTGLGSFVQNTFDGKVTVRDLNADGIVDFIVFDEASKTIKLIMSDGPDSSSEVELLKGYYFNDRICCYDFDNDGDVDILVPIDIKVGNHNNGAAFLVYFENDGKGNFNRSENWIDGDVRFFDCLDFDADGKYEIIACNSTNYELCFYEITGKEIADKPECFYQLKSSDITLLPVNTDNSGHIIIIGREYYLYSTFVYTTENANKRPSAPGKPQFMFNQEEGTLKLFWDAASDAETPTVDLTYEIRVGTAPGLDDVVAADALADGRRRSLFPGANGHQLYHTFNVSNWPSGKYYISVQAVDPNMMGSPFSEYAVFEKKLPATNFAIEAPDNTSVGEEILLRLTGNNASVKDVTWRLDDGEMLFNSIGACSVKFNTPGKKHISVVVTDDKGTAISKDRVLQIRPARVESFGDSQLRGISSMFDLDADGSEEFISSYENKIMEQNEAGDLSMVKKLYNSNLLSWNKIIPVDADRDGLVDLLSRGNGYNLYNLWSNKGDKNLEISDEFNHEYYGCEILYADFNNDGRLECVLESGSGYISMSDDCLSYLPFVKFSDFDCTRIKDIDDYNGDGLPDIYGKKKDWDFCIYYNNGDMTFREGMLLPKYKGEIKPSMLGVGDFDNDGKLDVLYDGYEPIYNAEVPTRYVESIAICYGNGRTIEVPCPDGNPFRWTTGIFDFDNNGFEDFCLRLKAGGDCIIYINSDYTYVINEVGDFGDEDCKVFHRNDGSTYIYNLQIYNYITDITNERPSAPGDIRHSVGDKFVNLAWSAASDKETPVAGLRYNISIKKKGAEGAGAYILSPMNLGKDNVSVPSDHKLLNTPNIAIPLASIPAGEYEVKVQAVDGQFVTGSFSQTYVMTVPEKSILEAPTSAIVGNSVEVKLLGNVASPTLDFGTDATITPKEGNVYDVVWINDGLKSLKVNGALAATLMVYEAPEAEFTIPEEVLEGATVNVMCPTAKKGNWEIISDGETTLLDKSSRASNVQVLDDKVVFTISGKDDFTLRHSVVENYGGTVVEHSSSINSNDARPSIDFVTISDNGDCNEIYWTAASIPADVEKVNVYRETLRINQYELIGSVQANEGKFTDMASLPNVKADRYAIAYTLPYGESSKSEPHRTMHLQLNKGLGNAVNLMWSKYEGREVTTYEIYGGDSEDALQIIEGISGYNTSYTADGSKAYYVVGVVFDESGRSAGRAIANPNSPKSNVAATSDASAALLANGLAIHSTDGTDVIDLDEKATLQLTALLSPAGVTIGQLDWYITKGSDIAQVDGTGLVTAHGTGEVTVNVATRDGSGLSASYDLTVRKLVSEITLNETETNLNEGETLQLIATVYPEIANNKTLEWVSNDETVATVDQTGLVTAVSQGGVHISAIATDGSGVWAYCHITVRKPVSEIILDKTEATIYKGLTTRLTATVLPEHADNRNLAWTSSNEAVATVEFGLVTGLLPGSAVITASSIDGSEVSASCNITVVDQSLSIALSESELEIMPGESKTLTATVSPEDAFEHPAFFEWVSTNTDVAIILDGAGIVMGVADGEADIIASIAGFPDVTATCHVTVRRPVIEIILNHTYLSLKEGDSAQLTATVRPDNATNATLAWSSTDPEIASVNDGLVLARKKGYANIIAEATDGSGVTAVCQVSVLENAGIEDVTDGAASVYVANRIIHFDNVAGLACRVIQLDGSEIYFDNSNSEYKKFAPSAAGMYIVVVGSKSYKVMIQD